MPGVGGGGQKRGGGSSRGGRPYGKTVSDPPDLGPFYLLPLPFLLWSDTGRIRFRRVCFPGRELSEFLWAYYLCAKANMQNSPSLLQNSVKLSEFSPPKQYSRNSIPLVSLMKSLQNFRNFPQGTPSEAALGRVSKIGFQGAILARFSSSVRFGPPPL